MKTIVLQEPGVLRVTDTASPGAPGPGEAVVRVRRVGICGTDLHAFRGRQPFFSYPRILGHELSVEIVELGPGAEGAELKAGDPCCLMPYVYCGECSACRRGKTNCCHSLRVLGVHTDGGMREMMTVPIEKLLKSETIPLDHLALVEMLCIGAHAVRRAQPRPGEPVLVIGAGPIGLGVIQFAQLAGAQVAVMEIIESRRAFCRQQFGIEHMLDGRQDPILQLQDIFEGNLPTTVFDATGNVRSMMKAFDYVDHGSKLVFVGLVQADVTFHDPDFHRRELTLMSSRNATMDDFRWVIQNLEAGKINLSPWITHRASPEEIVTAFPRWLEPATGVIKAMLTF